jgi:hypothetical protein
MAQMAIKNEVNTFASGQIFTDVLSVDGFGVSPAHYQFQQSGNITWQIRAFNTSDDLLFTRFQAGVFVDNPLIIDNLNGRFNFANICFFNEITRFATGNAVSPSLSFTDFPDLGIYAGGATTLAFATGGTTSAFLLPAQFRMFLSGSAAAPAYSFQPNTNMGMFRSSNNRMAFATAGISRMDIGTTRTQIFFNVEMPDLPTVDPGISGRLFISSGFVAISP